MKTDRFSDAIRRKLESIRPEFIDKDWTRMQSTLHQAGFPQPDPGMTANPFSGGVWSSNSWLLAAASVSTVALIAVGVWQHSQINDLRQTVSQLKQKATTTQVAPASPTPESSTSAPPTNGSSSVVKTQNSPSAPGLPSEPTSYEQGTAKLQRDTIYLDRYATAPTPSRSERGQESAAQPLTKPVDKGYAITHRKPVPTTDVPHQQTNLNVTPENDTYDISSTPLSADKSILNKPNQSVATDQWVNQPVKSNRLREKPVRREQYADTYSPTKSDKGVANQPVQLVPQSESTVETVNSVSADYESIASRPLSTKSLNWNALLARQAVKRMRPFRPATPAVDQALTAESQSRVERVAVQVRAGVGTEIASHLWGNGVFTEVLLGRHWLLSLGLNRTTYSYTFSNDDDFKEHTHRDFRNEFDLRIDQKRVIQNINGQTTRLQIPVFLGYRVPITKAIAFVPTVGTYLNLNSPEKATYYIYETYYPPMFFPQHRVDEFTTSTDRPLELISSLALGTGVEWQSKHWVAQASPVLTIPVQPEPNWQQNVTLGLRARVLYQF